MAQDERTPLLQRGIVDFMIAHDLLSYRIEKNLRPLAMNLTQLSLLNHFSRIPDKPATITDLVKVMAINQPGITKAVSALVARGRLAKRDSTDDARVKLVTITEEGLNALNQARMACFPAIEQAFDCLEDAELAALMSALGKLRYYLDTNR